MENIKNAKKIVIKIGTSTLTHKSGNINIKRFEELIKVIADLKNSGKDIIIVSSGAVGVGAGKLGLREKPSDIPSKQAIAAIGQCELMYLYDKLFGEYNHNVAQVLLTYSFLTNEKKVNNVKNTFNKLLEFNTIPIVNENDTVSTEELEFGDNDTLSAYVAGIVDADLLIILTDIDGLYNENPRENPNAKKIDVVEKIDDKILSIASSTNNEFGTGGMITKLKAGEIATKEGIDMIVMSSNIPSDLYKVFDGENVGTLFKRQSK